MPKLRNTQTASGLIVAETVPTPDEAAATAQEKTVERFRKIVDGMLQTLEYDLRGFGQTTHGSLLIHGSTLTGVLNALQDAYDNPRAFTISELSQQISAWLKERASS